MKTKFKRKRLIVDRGVQFRILGRMVWYLVLFVFVVVHLDFCFACMAIMARGTPPEQGISGLYVDFLVQRSPLFWCLLLLLPALLFDLLKFSHRFAGPLFRVRKIMQQMARGEHVPEFEPRKHDLMRELFSDFNKLIGEWNRRLDEGRRDEVLTAEPTMAAPNVP